MLSNIVDRIKLPFRKDKELYLALYEITGFIPRNITYYKVALMHKSLGHRATEKELKVLEQRNQVPLNRTRFGSRSKDEGRRSKDEVRGLGKRLNNERLEFLGDAVLDAVVGDIVYRQYPGKPEGFLTNTRSKLVQRETLGKLAKEVGLTRLILSSGRSASHNSYMGGNAFEALVGAMYLDRGYDACMKFWQERILGRYINIDKMAYKEVNFKSKLIEWGQKNRITIEFRLEDQQKDDNGSPTFKYTVVLEGVDGETGTGFSKKESQQKASEKTLKRLKSDKKFMDSVFAAKSEITKMEEEPVMAVPCVNEVQGREVQGSLQAQANKLGERPEVEEDEFSLDDIKAEPSKEEIIDKAIEEAYKV